MAMRVFICVYCVHMCTYTCALCVCVCACVRARARVPCVPSKARLKLRTYNAELQGADVTMGTRGHLTPQRREWRVSLQA
jgi:hypothetical protein